MSSFDNAITSLALKAAKDSLPPSAESSHVGEEARMLMREFAEWLWAKWMSERRKD